MKTKRYLLILTILFLTVIQVVLLNRESTSGEHLLKMQEEISLLEKDNDMLIQRIASSSSIQTIATKKEYLGLSENSETFALGNPLPIAQMHNNSL